MSFRPLSINSHEGNVQFRDIVNDTKKDYLAKSTKKLEKAHIAARVVQQIRQMDPPGRFLKEDGDTGMWCKFYCSLS
jgi:translation elongation factor P/translation initiation factor 5A